MGKKKIEKALEKNRVGKDKNVKKEVKSGKKMLKLPINRAETSLKIPENLFSSIPSSKNLKDSVSCDTARELDFTPEEKEQCSILQKLIKRNNKIKEN